MSFFTRFSRTGSSTPTRQSFHRRHLCLELLESRWVPTSSGLLDPRFSTDGLATVANGQSSSAGVDVAVQDDGKVVVAGNSGFEAVRFNRDGSLDNTFGSGGRIQLNLGGSSTCVAVQYDGKILLAGTGPNGFTVCRLWGNGVLDTSFGIQGISYVDFGRDEQCADIAVQPDGRIILVGSVSTLNPYSQFAIARLNLNGTLDFTFSGDGRQTVFFSLNHLNFDLSGSSYYDKATSVVVQADGKIVVGGYEEAYLSGPAVGSQHVSTTMAFVRLTTQGHLDLNYGIAGIRTILLPGGGSYQPCNDLALTSDGKVLAAGYTYNGTSYDFAVTRLTTGGNLDMSFTGDGWQNVGFDLGGDNEDLATGIAVRPDGKIVLAGSAQYDDMGHTQFAVCQLTSEGSLDTSFGTGGKTTFAFPLLNPGSDDRANALVLAADGVMVVGSVAASDVQTVMGVARLTREEQWVIVGADRGSFGLVRVYTDTGGMLLQFAPYGLYFNGGIRVASTDITGDGLPEIFTVPGPGGGPYVRIFDGSTLAMIRQIQVYGATFTLGVNLTVGDVLTEYAGNQLPGVELVVAPDTGGAPYVNILNPFTGDYIKQILVYGETFLGGVRVATGDVTGDSQEEVIVAPQATGAPFVNIFDAVTGMRVKQIQAFGDTFLAGLFIATGNVNNTGKVDLIVAPDATGAPYVNVFETSTGVRIASNQVFSLSVTFGLRVGVVDVNEDGIDEIITGLGPPGAPVVKIINGTTGVDINGQPFYVFPPTMLTGVFVAGGQRA